LVSDSIKNDLGLVVLIHVSLAVRRVLQKNMLLRA